MAARAGVGAPRWVVAIADVLAFRLYYRLFLRNRDRAWKEEKGRRTVPPTRRIPRRADPATQGRERPEVERFNAARRRPPL